MLQKKRTIRAIQNYATNRNRVCCTTQNKPYIKIKIRLLTYLGVVWFAQGNQNRMKKGNEGERNGFP